MAFQMIPPRVSSSPPPLDSLPTITCHTEDEDDDFADYSGGHNATFDITGLSDKLPPTPTSSPTKIFPSLTKCAVANSDQLNEKNSEDCISQGLGVGKEDQTCEFSHKLPSEDESSGDFRNSISVFSNANGEEAGDSIEKTEGKLFDDDDDDDFGDFECFPGENERPYSKNYQGEVVEENLKNMTNCKDSMENGAIIDSSSQVLASSIIKDGQNSSSDSESPPCFRSTVVSNSNDLSPPRSPSPIIVSPPRSPPPTMVSPPRSPPLRSPPPVMVSPPPLDKLAPRHISEDDEDEFGEFTTGHPGIMEDEDEDFGDFTSTNVNSFSSVHDSSNTIISLNNNSESPTFQNEFVENKESKINETNSINRSIELGSEQVTYTDSEVNTNSKVELDVDKVLSEDKSTLIGEDQQSAISEQLHGTDELTKERFADQILPNQNQNQIMENSGDKNSIEISNDTRTLELNDTKNLNIPFVKNNSLDSTTENGLYERSKSESECNDDDFGDFEGNFVQSKEVESYDDFVSPEKVIGDIRTTDSEILDAEVSKSSSLVKSCSNLNPSNIDDDDDEFGDFDSARRDSLDFEDIRSQVISRGISEVQCNDDLENNGDDNAFGDFENASFGKDPVSICNKERLDDIDDFGDFTNADFDTKHDLDDDDEFGDFNTSLESGSFKTETSSNTIDTNSSKAVEQKITTNEEDKSQLVKKLESLLLRWIPPISRELRTTDNNTRRLQQVVKEDAFIWHQLEDLDSSPALNLDWPQSHAQKLFLSSVNVDARNILFGQKWSTSVPLFAQTLTFSPLTPAKHIESAEECLQSQNLATKCPQKPAEATVEACKSGGIKTKGEDTEEKIPEPKFDWTSSGLTNPLESTGLEREFLSESGSSGNSGGGPRLGAPPSPSPLVQQILSGGTVGGGSGSSLSSRTTTNVTQINSLQPEVQKIVAKLPDLNFMKSRVLMFPIKGEQL